LPVAWLLLALLVTACADEERDARAAALRGAAENPPALQTSRMRSAEPSMAGPSDAALASADPAERERAVLEFEGDLAALAPIASDDASAEVRLAAVQRLAEGETPVVRAALRRALDDPDSGVVVEAILTLSTLGDRAAIPSLERLRAHPDPELRALAEDALGTLALD
jgi:HEAT repeat protein